MPVTSTVQRFGAICVLVVCLLPGGGLRAQIPEPVTLEAPPPPVVAPAPGPKSDGLNRDELLESYRRVQDQLRQTQESIVKNRLEAEAVSMAQSAAFAEKLDMIQALMAAEHRRQQELSDRAEFERTRQDAELQQSHHTVLWVAAAFGGVGLLAMLLAARLQWRTINRLAEAGELRLQLAGPDPSGHELTHARAELPSEHAVAQANQLMMSAISRMERRIFELENSAHPMPTGHHSQVGSGEKALA